jgi:hypothetical protein
MSSNKRKGSVREYRTKRELLEFLKSEFLKYITYVTPAPGAWDVGRRLLQREHSSILVNVNALLFEHPIVFGNIAYVQVLNVCG